MNSREQEAAQAQLVQELEILHRRLAELEKLAEVHQEERKKLIHLNRFLKAIRQCNEALIYSFSETDLMQEICRIIVEVGGYKLAWVGFAGQDKAKTVRPVAKAGYEEGYLSQVQISWADAEHGRGPVGTCIRTGQPVALQNLSAESGLDPWLQEAARRGYQAALAIPLVDEDKAFGALAIYAKEPDAFDSEEQSLLKELGDDLAFGIAALRAQGQRRQAELAAEAARQERSNIFQAIGNPSLILDENRRIISANKAVAAVTRLSEAELVGKTCYEVLHTEAHKDCPVNQLLFSPSARTTERVIETLGGVFLVSCTPEFNEAGQLWRIIVIATDITESVKVKEALVKAAEEWRTTFDTIPDPIMISALDHRIIRVNQAFAKAVGLSYAEILGKPFYQVLDGSETLPEPHPIHQTLADHKSHALELSYPKLARYFLVTTTPILDESGAMTGAVHVMQDITERKQMELQSIQTEKLASLGVMAGGVAHEINNPLAGILGIAQLLLMDYPEHGELTEDLKNIEGAALHCSEIVKNLLTFARKGGTGARETVEIPALVDQVLKLVGYQFSYQNIQVRKEFAPDFLLLQADRTQLQQVLINLLINAQQAMGKGGEVFIRGKLLPAGEVAIEIEDQGCGIPAAIRDKIFDPFFTTKEQGQGTGLGLSVSYRIIQEHGGRMEVESEPGQGTCMRLIFPPGSVSAAAGGPMEAST